MKILLFSRDKAARSVGVGQSCLRRIAACAVFALAACAASAEDANVIHRSGEPEVVQFDTEDAEMNAAIAAARRTFAEFSRHIEVLRAAGDYYSIKVPLPLENGREHIWLASPTLALGRVTGALGNAPLSDRYREGQSVSVSADEISDWMVVREGKLFGGYTVLVARSRMSMAERAEFDASLDFVVPAVAEPFGTEVGAGTDVDHAAPP